MKYYAHIQTNVDIQIYNGYQYQNVTINNINASNRNDVA